MADRGEREGQRLGNYRLVRLLGHGGFADVYLGEHVYLKTPAAVKLLQTKVVSKDAREGFLKEAQTIARLNHPNIVRILDFGVERKTPFLVMDYAPNGTLRQRHPNGTQLPLTTIITYVRQIADGLQYAHEEKVIHRDIKPENMLVGRRNEVLLSDFGIALATQTSRYQSTQDIVGTVAYMAPEQIQAQPLQASDQYALAVVIYEWLCGELPFHGSFKELCTQHLFATPPPLREKVPTISPDVERAVMTALAKDPMQRFPHVEAFANVLEEASRTEVPQFVTPAQQTPALPPSPQPASSASPVRQGLQPTEKVVPLNPVQTPGGSRPFQLLKTPGAPASSTKTQPFRKRLQYALNTGGIAGILTVLLHIVIVLSNASTFREASKEMAGNRLTVNTAFAVVGVQSLNFFVSLLIFFIAGFVVGKIVARRSLGFFAGALSGATLYIATFLVSFIPTYPGNTTLEGIGGAGIVGSGIVISLVFLCIWSIIGGLVSLLGSWLATRKHPYYVG